MKFHIKLGVHVHLFANKLKVVQHRDHKQFAEVACYGLYVQNKFQNRIHIQFSKLSENIYFTGVSVDGLHTISVGTKTPILLQRVTLI